MVYCGHTHCNFVNPLLKQQQQQQQHAIWLKLSIPSVPLIASPVVEWTLASSPFQELHSDVGSDGSARGLDMSG